jgi:hypothetical protein
MTQWIRSAQRPFLRRLLALSVLALVLQASALSADDCERTDIKGEPRNCTFLEEIKDCMDDVLDSWTQCMWEADGLIDRIACEAAGFVDNTACVAASIPRWGLKF